MTEKSGGDLGSFSMLELFRVEVENQAKIFSDSILGIEDTSEPAELLESAMRAAHSIKGAARMVDIDVAVRIAHAMEDCLVSFQEHNLIPASECIDVLLQGMDLLVNISNLNEGESDNWFSDNAQSIEMIINQLSDFTQSVLESIVESVSGNQPDTAVPADAQPADANISFAPPSADAAMLELFRSEADIHTDSLSKSLLELEADPQNDIVLEKLMRAAHSIKGAARIVDLTPIVDMTHIIEDGFVAGQEKKLTYNSDMVDCLLKAIDIIKSISDSTLDNKTYWLESTENIQTYSSCMVNVRKILTGDFVKCKGSSCTSDSGQTEDDTPIVKSDDKSESASDPAPVVPANDTTQSSIKINASALNRLMGLAGESIIESRRLRPYADSMLALKRRQIEMISQIDKIHEHLVTDTATSSYIEEALTAVKDKAVTCRELLSERLEQLEEFDRSFNSLSTRLNREVIHSRMRPFSDGVHGFQRMVRDLSRSLDKKVKLTIKGLNTQVDRDILEKIEAPLNHLIRNSVDHGIEMPQDRIDSGKPEMGNITLEAMHNSGMLTITLKDDGRGVDYEKLKRKILDKGLVSNEMAKNLSEAELLEFLYLPSFSTREDVTEISGRGVGLDVVQSTIQEMRGQIRTSSETGKGICFHFQLPLTLSVIRALLVEICDEPYAFPLARIQKTVKINKSSIETLEGRQYFTLGNQHIGIVSSSHVFGKEHLSLADEELSVIIIGEKLNKYGIVVDKFLGERNLVVQVLDPRLGRVQDISAAAILDNGDPALIIDVDDMIRSIDLLISGGRIANVDRSTSDASDSSRKRILIVDDSITVREVERSMLESKGYLVEVAVDGQDGWNAVRTSNYDLVISDVDMPRMNGFELVSMIKQDTKLGAIPVMIVSYKDREEDRMRGLDAGADYYLTKGSFHDETLLNAVQDLIGNP